MWQRCALFFLAFSASSVALAIERDCLELLTEQHLSYEQNVLETASPHVTFAEFEAFLRASGFATDPLVRAAVNQAILSHSSQTRDSGADYLEQHVFPVAISVARAVRALGLKRNDFRKIVAAALLHDALEDDVRLTDALFVSRFGQEVYDLVKPLSKPRYEGLGSKQQLFRSYVEGIANAALEVRLIKLADRLNNIVSTRAMRTVNGKVLAYIAETEKFYLPIAQATSEYYFLRLKFQVEQLKLFVGDNTE